ncbi:toxin-antitoxin system YwqK family antitoxin [Flectobacillus roseus]|uniref:Uncharacterized protein n=1 Tax=Flectobacillus roseus TaxID=502259 RepID=A0ABT6Y964_9BACT|nr:hypothetical protein [Flectobacillus roseus]MDI9860122.1 hypothetical protein [Flectobacillus roseus]
MRSLSFPSTFISLISILLLHSTVTCIAQQKDEFKSSSKPKTDTTARKKGILGGLIQTDVLDNIKNAKKTISDVKDDIKNNKEKAEEFSTDLSSDLGLKVKKDAKKSKKVKKAPKDEYSGIKFERRIGEYGTGNRFTVEEINVLRNPDEATPSIYAKEIWWYDPKLRRITNTPRKDLDYGEVCHGPFKKYINDELVEEGFFYVGVKDGRWETYNQEYILLSKDKYKNGFPAESHFSYYDKEQKKLKEVIPVKFGKVTGEYRAFYDGGQLKEEGKFEDSIKVGRWREYHQFGAMGRLKKETMYPKDKFEKGEAVVLQERDNTGKLIYEAPKQQKRKVEDDDN